MKLTKEIGGHFALECYGNSPYHKGAIALNSARNALRYIARAYNINIIAVPYYTCPVVWRALQSENCRTVPYDLDNNLMPTVDFDKNAFVLYTNYFGVCGYNIEILAKKYPCLIIDNAQAFFAPKRGIASFYSPRKFFGLPDGGLALCEKKCNDNFDTAISYDICSHLLKQHDKCTHFGDEDFIKNDDSLADQQIKHMSMLTRALMSNINYHDVQQKRLKNFKILHEALKTKNALKLNISTYEIPMKYPLLTQDVTIRDKLIKNNVIIDKYWDIEEGCNCMRSVNALKLKNTLITLPLDQRYNETDMKRIVDIINN